MEATFAAIERDHGLIRVLFNNAGIHHPGKDWINVPPEQFDGAMSIHVRVCRTPLPSGWAKRLIAAGQPGAIVTTASVAGQRGSAVTEYGASKAAVINVTSSLGTRLGRRGIRVNLIAPGLIDAARVPVCRRQRRRMPGPAHWAAPASRRGSLRWWISWRADAASFITSATIDVNGGL